MLALIRYILILNGNNKDQAWKVDFIAFVIEKYLILVVYNSLDTVVKYRGIYLISNIYTNMMFQCELSESVL